MDHDGTKNGFAVALTRHVSEAVPVPVIASGGITNMDDIRALSAVEDEGIMGAITGRAIYDGSIDLKECQDWLDAQAK